MRGQGLKHYLAITGGYWAFTLTDGAIRMLVLLYFHELGYSPLAIAMLFLFYEFFGVLTNLVGGWLGARMGLNRTMHLGMILQILALGMLLAPVEWLTVAYVMAAQGLSGIAKDLNKMSAKAGVKLLLPSGEEGQLFRWVAWLTGSKNALKGAGFFLGGALLQGIGFSGALICLMALLAVALGVTGWMLPAGLGRVSGKPKFQHMFAKSAAVNWLSAARFFLFGARDVWFVVALPVFLQSVLGWSFSATGAFLALWVIGYGAVQALAPGCLRLLGLQAGGGQAAGLAGVLALVPLAMVVALEYWPPAWVMVAGLGLFGVLFALSSSLHSFLIVHWSEREQVSMNVGFYYMANAGGRLLGTVLSGLLYQYAGMTACLLGSAVLLCCASLLSFKLRSAGLQAIDKCA